LFSLYLNHGPSFHTPLVEYRADAQSQSHLL
jgi:hypothetical protein